MGDILDIKTVQECNCCLGCKTLHPQASVICLDDNSGVEQRSIRFDFYAVLLIDHHGDSSCCCCCGKKYYDYSDATVVFLSPEKAFDMTRDRALPRKGWLLAFHPDLLYGTELGRAMCGYTFFSYDRDEALHLSLKEKNKIVSCLQGIDEELHHPVDMHSRSIITHHIELLLDYCKRYYHRQFVTREDKNKALIDSFAGYVDGYIEHGRLRSGVFPTAEMCASHLHLSAQYFIDLLKFVTGKTLREYMETKRLATAKLMLVNGLAPARVAAELGYPSVQCFSLMFKKITGLTPQEYKLARN